MRVRRNLLLGGLHQLPGGAGLRKPPRGIGGGCAHHLCYEQLSAGVIMVSSKDASQLDMHDFPQMLAKLNSVGITESIKSYPEAGHYKQWVVPVGFEVQHAFEYWALVKKSVIAWLQAGVPSHSHVSTNRHNANSAALRGCPGRQP